jgi:uncharacterized protein
VDHDFEIWIASVAALSTGPLLYVLARRLGMQRVLHVVLLAAIGGLVLVEILPECVAVAGWTALGAAAAGVIVPMVAERGHDHGLREVGPIALVLALSGVVVHGLTDGLALASTHDHAHAGGGQGLLAALLLHRVPEGAALWWLARRHSATAGVLAIAADAVATSIGIFGGGTALTWVDAGVVALFQAFVGGVLLHVLLHARPEPEAAHSGGISRS